MKPALVLSQTSSIQAQGRRTAAAAATATATVSIAAVAAMRAAAPAMTAGSHCKLSASGICQTYHITHSIKVQLKKNPKRTK